jgi:hypothetical protein
MVRQSEKSLQKTKRSSFFPELSMTKKKYFKKMTLGIILQKKFSLTLQLNTLGHLSMANNLGCILGSVYLHKDKML